MDLNAIEKKKKDPIKNNWEKLNEKRPSIETSMHAIMPHKCVLHVHCVNTLSWIVQENYLEKIKVILKDENWISIPYKKPAEVIKMGLPGREKELHNIIKERNIIKLK